MATQRAVSATNIAEHFADNSGVILLGIDGYIDEIWEIIASRIDLDTYVPYERMKDFSQLLVQCGTGGVSNEIIRKRRTHGGFTANTGKAVSRLGVSTTLLGMFGHHRIDSVFDVFAPENTVISVGDPAVSHIFEFPDGKILLPYIQEIMRFNWHSLLSATGAEALTHLYQSADIIALGYWSLMPAFDEIAANICNICLSSNKKQQMFFDFADIRKRNKASLTHTLQKLSELNRQMPMTLSLNEHEAALLFDYFGETFVLAKGEAAETAAAQTERVRQKIGLHELVVHTPYWAAASSLTEGYSAVLQRFCEKPCVTTGAGDNFNGGYLAAMLKQLPIRARLTVANTVTGFYVSCGYAPDKAEMLEALPAYCLN